MSGNVKTNYILSSIDTPRVGRRKARRAVKTVREATRASRIPSPSVNIGISMPSEAEVAQAVTDYFSEPKFGEFHVRQEYEIPIGDTRYRADIVLCDKNKKDAYAVIAECKLQGVSNYGSEPLKSFLCATDTPFGVLASGIDINSWYFYENLHHNRFRLIERSDFETGLLEGLSMPTTDDFELM